MVRSVLANAAGYCGYRQDPPGGIFLFSIGHNPPQQIITAPIDKNLWRDHAESLKQASMGRANLGPDAKTSS